MYVEKIKINKFRVLEDVEIRFQPPDLTAVEEGRGNGNVVNVIAGVNGTGKTSLLDFFFLGISTPSSIPQQQIGEMDVCVKKHTFKVGSDPMSSLKLDNKLNEYKNVTATLSVKKTYPRIVFISAMQNLHYKTAHQIDNSYHRSKKIDSQQLLGTAEFYIKEFVLGRERESSIADPKQRTQIAIDAFNKHFLEAKMLTKLVDLDSAQFNRPVFENAAGERVTIDQLSDGEKQLYGRVIALMILEPQNSVVLIDEPEIALHPAWQQKIMQIYSNIGKNNQFIVATHSPQVIRSVPYQNRIILHKQDGKIQPLYYTQPPSGVDVNTILSEVMGADPVPSQLTELQAKYRALVERKQESTDEAKKLKAELLDYESEHSSFMQEMDFLIELRDAA